MATTGTQKQASKTVTPPKATGNTEYKYTNAKGQPVYGVKENPDNTVVSTVYTGQGDTRVKTFASGKTQEITGTASEGVTIKETGSQIDYIQAKQKAQQEADKSLQASTDFYNARNKAEAQKQNETGFIQSVQSNNMPLRSNIPGYQYQEDLTNGFSYDRQKNPSETIDKTQTFGLNNFKPVSRVTPASEVYKEPSNAFDVVMAERRKITETKEIEAGRQGNYGLAKVYGAFDVVSYPIRSTESIYNLAKTGAEGVALGFILTAGSVPTGGTLPLFALAGGTAYYSSKIPEFQEQIAYNFMVSPRQGASYIAEKGAEAGISTLGGYAGSKGFDVAKDVYIDFKTEQFRKSVNTGLNKDYYFSKDYVIENDIVKQQRKVPITPNKAEYQTQLSPKVRVIEEIPQQPLKVDYFKPKQGYEIIGQENVVSKYKNRFFTTSSEQYPLISEVTGESYFKPKVLYEIDKNVVSFYEPEPTGKVSATTKLFYSVFAKTPGGKILTSELQQSPTTISEGRTPIFETTKSSLSIEKPAVLESPVNRIPTTIISLDKYNIPTSTQTNSLFSLQTPIQTPISGQDINQIRKPVTDFSLRFEPIQTTIQEKDYKSVLDFTQKQESTIINDNVSITEQIQDKTTIINLGKFKPIETKTQPPSVPPPKVLPLFRTETQKKKKTGLYKLLIRRRGQFKQAGIFGSEQEAFKKGSNIVGSTASASLKVITPEGRPSLAGRLNPKQFYSSRKEPGVYIERPSQRIKSAGEKAEITFKGIATNRKAKRGVFGGF